MAREWDIIIRISLRPRGGRISEHIFPTGIVGFRVWLLMRTSHFSDAFEWIRMARAFSPCLAAQWQSSLATVCKSCSSSTTFKEENNLLGRVHGREAPTSTTYPEIDGNRSHCSKLVSWIGRTRSKKVPDMTCQMYSCGMCTVHLCPPCFQFGLRWTTAKPLAMLEMPALFKLSV